MHGGLDPNRETIPVIGQKQIHQKIQQLNFHDCHAKITQVDSQATLGKGVVVQVTGELSNAGQPMRRFTQTFVLASQSPKKYYVHNDIFRYQDEIISDEECENESRSEPGDENTQECPVLGDAQQINQPPLAYYAPNSPPMAPALAPVTHHQPPHVLSPQPVPTVVNGAAHPDELNAIPPGVSHVTAIPPQVMSPPMANIPPPMVQPLPAVIPVEEQPQIVDEMMIPLEDQQPEIVYNEPAEPELEPQDLGTEPVVCSNEPKTYANSLKSGNAPFNNPALNTPYVPQQPRVVTPVCILCKIYIIFTF